MRRSVLLAITAAFVPASAQAATTIGSLPPGGATIDACPGGSPETVWQNTSPTGTVTAPSAGVITSVRTQQSAGHAGHTFKVKVITLNDRSFSPAANVTVSASSDPLTIAGTGSPESRAVRLPIAAGQGIALFTTESADCSFATSDTNDTVLFNGDPEPGPGTTIAAQDGAMGARAILEATVEPDADGDGFGDETQDTCPSDPGTHTGACSADVSLTGTITPSTIGVGDVAVLTGAVANGGNATAAGVALQVTPSVGLQIIATIPSAGCTFTTALSCPLGTMLKAGSAPVAIVVKGTKTGAQSLSASVASSTADPNAANNTVSAPIKVEQQVPLVCTVPKLNGLTKSFAKKLLAAVHCKLGKVTRKTSKAGKKGTVIKQSKKAASVLPAGSKVAVTLKK